MPDTSPKKPADRTAEDVALDEDLDTATSPADIAQDTFSATRIAQMRMDRVARLERAASSSTPARPPRRRAAARQAG